MNESKLVYECMQILGKHGAIFRTNAGQFYTKSGQTVSGLPKGFTDLLFIRRDGIACFIECKTGKNKTSPAQEHFIKRMQTLGCIARTAYTAEQAAQLCGIIIN